MKDDFEIKFYEGILKNSPDFIEALIALGDLYTKKGFYKKGLKIDLRLARLRPEDSIVFYNLACDYSLLNQTSKALEVLKKAISLGYDDLNYLKKDKDLENLKRDERFEKFLSLLKEKNFV